jgi:hypothetical protein
VRTWWSIAKALDMPVGALMNHLDDVTVEDTVPSSTMIIK